MAIRQPQTILPWSMTVSCNLDIVSWLQLQFPFSERFCQQTLDVFFHCIILILFDCCINDSLDFQGKSYVHLSTWSSLWKFDKSSTWDPMLVPCTEAVSHFSRVWSVPFGCCGVLRFKPGKSSLTPAMVSLQDYRRIWNPQRCSY